MPFYRFRCSDCGTEFEEKQSFDDDLPECPECDSEDVKRLITNAPTHARGVLTHAGDGYRASHKQLRDKWREETPKLRKKLRDKLGDDAVNDLSFLNTNYSDD